MRINSTIILLAIASIWLFQTACKKPSDEIQPAPEFNERADTSSLVVQIKGFKNTNGKVNIALYNTGSSFNNPDQIYRSSFVSVSGNPTEVTFDSIPSGDYAFAVFHDENNNQNLDQNFLGIPKEGFCFSNNAMGSFGPPSYDKAKFNIPSKSKVTQVVDLVFY